MTPFGVVDSGGFRLKSSKCCHRRKKKAETISETWKWKHLIFFCQTSKCFQLPTIIFQYLFVKHEFTDDLNILWDSPSCKSENRDFLKKKTSTESEALRAGDHTTKVDWLMRPATDRFPEKTWN